MSQLDGSLTANDRAVIDVCARDYETADPIHRAELMQTHDRALTKAVQRLEAVALETDSLLRAIAMRREIIARCGAALRGEA